jgi:inactivated superfamily I helicase
MGKWPINGFVNFDWLGCSKDLESADTKSGFTEFMFFQIAEITKYVSLSRKRRMGSGEEPRSPEYASRQLEL